MTEENDTPEKTFNYMVSNLHSNVQKNKKLIIEKINIIKQDKQLLFLDKILKKMPEMAHLYQDINDIYGPPLDPQTTKALIKHNQETLKIIRRKIAVDYAQKNKQQ